jgi:cell division protein FtsB
MKKIILISILSLFSYTTIFAAITTREDINFLKDESDYNITQRSHIAYLQDESDYNITQRSHIAYLQDESDYNITQRSHIREYQELSKQQSFWNWLIFG